MVLLNADHEPIGEVPRTEVHSRRTPLHLAFSLYVFNDRGETLITRRALSKPPGPGYGPTRAAVTPVPASRCPPPSGAGWATSWAWR